MMLPIMPWCRLDRTYQVGDVTITPYYGRLDGVDDAVQRRLARVLGTYRTIEGRPVDHAAVVLYADRGFGADLTPEEIDSAYEWVQLACFAGLGPPRVLHAGVAVQQRCLPSVHAAPPGR